MVRAKFLLSVIMIIAGWLIYQPVAAVNFATNLIPVKYQPYFSALIVDAKSGRTVLQYNQNKPQLIASNMKLFTTLIALEQLGPDYHWHTKLYYDGSINREILNGNLYLIGSGDPVLDTRDLYQMFATLKRKGIARINGNIILDDSIFNTKPTYSDLDHQQYDADSVMPNGIIFDGNLTHIYIEKNTSLNKFELSSDLYNYNLINKIEIDNNIKQCLNPYHNIQLELIDNNLTVTGKLSNACTKFDLIFALLPSFHYNQMRIQQVLDDLSIDFNGQYLQKSELSQPGLPQAKLTNNNILYDYRSASLEEVLIKMNRFSVNLIATTVMLTSGLAAYPQLDSYSAAKKLFNNFIKAHNLTNAKAAFENGSGNSRREYFSSQNVVDLLALANKSLQQANFEASLAVTDQEGTLKQCLYAIRGRVHAKTGTLDDVKAVSGYFYSRSGKKYIFSFVINNFDTKQNGNTQDFYHIVEQLLRMYD